MHDADDRAAMKALQVLPNVGPATAGDFLLLGVRSVAAVAEQDADDLYERLQRVSGVRQDPCVHDVFAAAIDAARGKPAKPWWEYSRARKAKKAKQR